MDLLQRKEGSAIFLRGKVCKIFLTSLHIVKVWIFQNVQRLSFQIMTLGADGHTYVQS